MREEKEHVYVNLARLKKGGETFEVDVDPDMALKFRKGDPTVTIRDVLKAGRVFKDAQKGLAASETLLKDLFKTDDMFEIGARIVREGEIQLTGEYRAQLREAKRRRILDIVHRNGIDPGTKLPHPLVRIEAALVEAKVRIDEFKSPEEQINDVLAGIRKVLPIAFAQKQIWIHVPAVYAPKAQGLIRAFSKLLKEEWKSDGSWEITVEIPGGLQEDFFDKLNHLTKGNIQSKILKEI